MRRLASIWAATPALGIAADIERIRCDYTTGVTLTRFDGVLAFIER